MFRGVWFKHWKEYTHFLYRTSKLPNPRSRRDVKPSGRRLEHAQYVTFLKIYFGPRLTGVAVSDLKVPIVNIKHRGLTSVAFMQLVFEGRPSRVRHICIWCMWIVSDCFYGKKLSQECKKQMTNIALKIKMITSWRNRSTFRVEDSFPGQIKIRA